MKGRYTVARYAKVLVDAVLQADRVLSSGWRLFDYSVPDGLKDQVRPGQMVEVPFGRQTVMGVVAELSEKTEMSPGKVRDIDSLLSESSLLSSKQLQLCSWITRRYLCSAAEAVRLFLPPGLRHTGSAGPPKARRLVVTVDNLEDACEQLGRAVKQRTALVLAYRAGEPLTRKGLAERADCSPSTVDSLVNKGYLEWTEVSLSSRPYGTDCAEQDEEPPNLTRHQASALSDITAGIESQQFVPYLLYGVTGSGKTEVYLRVIDQVLSRGGGAILLVPEISLTPQMVDRVRARLGDTVAVLHSALPERQRRDEWYRLFAGEARVALGPRSAVFAPCDDLGVIILDEEHETSYKQDSSPRYHTREVALKRCQLTKAVTILGSATPSLESFYRARSGRTHISTLPNRIDDRPMPTVELVDMRKEERRQGHKSIFSRRLMDEMKDRLQRGHQVLLFLNQRGYSAFVMCSECGEVVGCHRCNVSMTYHRDARALKCHYCGRTQAPPEVCQNCGGREIFRGGTGTQKVEAAVISSFPGATVERMDTDAVRKRGRRTQIYRAFSRGEVDVLVGTQMIAKGWDIPSVTLVGVIDADIALHFPDFRSAERTFHLVTQVSGRCGRGDDPGQVVVQTRNPDHPALQFAQRGQLHQFYSRELQERKETHYPPFSRLARIIIRGDSEQMVKMWAEEIKRRVQDVQDEHQGSTLEVLGPVSAPIDRLQGQYRWHLFVRSGGLSVMLNHLKETLGGMKRGRDDPRIVLDIDPVQML